MFDRAIKMPLMFFQIAQLRKMQPKKQGLVCGNIRPLQILNTRKVMKFVSGVLLPTGKPTKRRTTIRLATGASKTQRRATRRRTTLSQM